MALVEILANKNKKLNKNRRLQDISDACEGFREHFRGSSGVSTSFDSVSGILRAFYGSNGFRGFQKRFLKLSRSFLFGAPAAVCGALWRRQESFRRCLGNFMEFEVVSGLL